MQLITRSSLDGFLWEQMKRTYGYVSEQPGLRDFVIELFQSCFLMGTDPEHRARLSSEILVFMKRWKDSRSHEESFEALSEDCAEVLRIDERLETLDYRRLMELDTFELIDRKILSELVRALEARTVTVQEVDQWVRQRRESHFGVEQAVVSPAAISA